MQNEERLSRYLKAYAPFHAADPLGHQARVVHGLSVQARLRAPKVDKAGKVIQISKGKRHG
jgi:hypothetical protein